MEGGADEDVFNRRMDAQINKQTEAQTDWPQRGGANSLALAILAISSGTRSDPRRSSVFAHSTDYSTIPIELFPLRHRRCRRRQRAHSFVNRRHIYQQLLADRFVYESDDTRGP